jgi:hypothetical protein
MSKHRCFKKKATSNNDAAFKVSREGYKALFIRAGDILIDKTK